MPSLSGQARQSPSNPDQAREPWLNVSLHLEWKYTVNYFHCVKNPRISYEQTAPREFDWQPSLPPPSTLAQGDPSGAEPRPPVPRSLL